MYFSNLFAQEKGWGEKELFFKLKDQPELKPIGVECCILKISILEKKIFLASVYSF